MWESDYKQLILDNWGQMMPHINRKMVLFSWCSHCFNLFTFRWREHSTEEAKPEPAALASTVRAKGHTLLIWPCCYLLLLMENFLKQGSVSPQTQTSGGQSGGKRKRNKEDSITKRPWQDVGVTSLHKHTHPTCHSTINIGCRAMDRVDIYTPWDMFCLQVFSLVCSF